MAVLPYSAQGHTLAEQCDELIVTHIPPSTFANTAAMLGEPASPPVERHPFVACVIT